jgi:hypothetical protein
MCTSERVWVCMCVCVSACVRAHVECVHVERVLVCVCAVVSACVSARVCAHVCANVCLHACVSEDASYTCVCARSGRVRVRHPARVPCLPPCFLRSLHRSLAYPYLRMWRLAELALHDVAMVFTLGRRCVLRCLLHVRALFEASQCLGWGGVVVVVAGSLCVAAFVCTCGCACVCVLTTCFVACLVASVAFLAPPPAEGRAAVSAERVVRAPRRVTTCVRGWSRVGLVES